MSFPIQPRPGTPAARMPQVDAGDRSSRSVPRACARQGMRRREARHLAAQQGKTHRILMESPQMGRTEQFAEVEFVRPQPEGRIVSATISGQIRWPACRALIKRGLAPPSASPGGAGLTPGAADPAPGSAA